MKPRWVLESILAGPRMTRRHHIKVFYSAEDCCHVADVSDLKNCFARGAPPEEALTEALLARISQVKSARAGCEAAPCPAYRPAILALASRIAKQPRPIF